MKTISESNAINSTQASAEWAAALLKSARLLTKAMRLGSLLLSVVLAGCAARSKTFQPATLATLNLGATKSEVIQTLGPPVQAATRAWLPGLPNDPRVKTNEVFQYAQILRRGHSTNFFLVFFDEGKVVDYGPQLGRLRNLVVDVLVEETNE